MKPNFALNLSHDGLSLLQRARDGWQVIGSVALDDNDLSGKLSYLRRTATNLSGGQMATKLIIPNTEILYRLVDTQGQTDAERRASIVKELDGATPYKIDDLTFDWADAGDDQAHVAAVARETLQEAEDFAAEHRFNPVSFVAIPESDEFVGEPFFGETSFSPAILPDGETVESDPGPIQIIRDHDPDTAPEPSDNFGTKLPETGNGTDEKIETEPQSSVEELADSAVAQQVADAAVEKQKADAALAKHEVDVTKVELEADAAIAEIDAANEIASDDDAVADGEIDEETVERVDEDISFGSSRNSEDEPAELALEIRRQDVRFALYPDKVQDGDSTEQPSQPVTPMQVTAPDVAGDELLDDGKGDTSTEQEPQNQQAQPTTRQQPVNDAYLKSSRSISSAQVHLLSQPKFPNSAPGSSVFDKTYATGQPSSKKLIGIALGLGMAAMILLAILVSSVFFDSPISSSSLLRGFSEPDTATTREALTTPQIVATSIEPAVGDTLKFSQPDVPLQSDPDQPFAKGANESGVPLAFGNDDGSNGDLELVTLSPPTQPVSPGRGVDTIELADTDPASADLGEISIQEAVVIEASTGVWVLAPIPPVGLFSEELDDFYVASIDPKMIGHDAVALPELVGPLNDHRPGEFPSPAPAGTTFDLDERGFVRATQNGAISADGVKIFAGKPSVVPPVRPGSSSTFETASVAVRQIPNTRPTLRPAGLVEINERATFGGRSRSELAAIRPTPRPASPQQIHITDNQTPTTLAVLVSRSPTLRPSNFARIVAASHKAADEARAIQTVSDTPAAPVIPTTASVAREATITDAINLTQRVNLIGIYGSSNDRRALVRLKNGRYLKVKIGDKLDGGKVAAINGKRLQYIKGGRMVTLEIAS